MSSFKKIKQKPCISTYAFATDIYLGPTGTSNSSIGPTGEKGEKGEKGETGPTGYISIGGITGSIQYSMGNELTGNSNFKFDDNSMYVNTIIPNGSYNVTTGTGVTGSIGYIQQGGPYTGPTGPAGYENYYNGNNAVQDNNYTLSSIVINQVGIYNAYSNITFYCGTGGTVERAILCFSNSSNFGLTCLIGEFVVKTPTLTYDMTSNAVFVVDSVPFTIDLKFNITFVGGTYIPSSITDPPTFYVVRIA
jgi:hypothetical protein